MQSLVYTHAPKHPPRTTKKTQCIPIRNSCVVHFEHFLKGANKGSKRLKRWKWNETRICVWRQRKRLKLFSSNFWDGVEGWNALYLSSVVTTAEGWWEKRKLTVRVLSIVSFHFIWMPSNSRQEKMKKICSNATPAKRTILNPTHTYPKKNKLRDEHGSATAPVYCRLQNSRHKTMEIHDADKFERFACVRSFVQSTKTKARNENGK